MNEQLQEQLAELVKFLIESAQSVGAAGTDLALQEAPHVIREILIWAIVYNMVWVTVLASLSGACFYLSFRLRRALKEEDVAPYSRMRTERQDALWFLGKWGTPLLGGFFALMTVIPLSGALQAWLTPRLYLLEYAASQLAQFAN